MPETAKGKFPMANALLPIRHPNRDFFICDIFDSMPGFRDDRASMEHPIFSLSSD
jgi:hypothetical protein